MPEGTLEVIASASAFPEVEDIEVQKQQLIEALLEYSRIVESKNIEELAGLLADMVSELVVYRDMYRNKFAVYLKWDTPPKIKNFKELQQEEISSVYESITEMLRNKAATIRGNKRVMGTVSFSFKDFQEDVNIAIFEGYKRAHHGLEYKPEDAERYPFRFEGLVR